MFLFASSPHEVETRLQRAIKAFASGEFVIVMDDKDRENEGDLICAAELLTEDQMAFMVNETSGIICCPITEERANELNLPLMIEKEKQQDPHGTAFTISCDAENVTTGISSFDRCTTFHVLADRSTTSINLRRPGHVFPLIAHPQGLDARKGHTEASLALCELSGVGRIACISELVNKDGSMSRENDCIKFGKRHRLEIITIRELYYYMKAQKDQISLEKALTLYSY